MNRKQDALIEHLKKGTRMLQNPRLEKAFRAVDRKYFVPEEFLEEAYQNYPLPIGFGATISQPTTVAFMLEQLDVRPGQKVLDVGSGSGWTTALLAHLVGLKGTVIGLEIVPELVEFGRRNLAKYYSLIRANKRIVENAEIRQAETGVLGLPKEAPFDRILVSAASDGVPEVLTKQLAYGGKMVIPVGHSLVIVGKSPNGSLQFKEYGGFRFVPLRNQ